MARNRTAEDRRDRDQWTILLVRSEGEPVRQMSVSPRLIKAGATAAVLLVLTLLGGAVALGVGGSAHLQVHRLSGENEMLSGKLQSMRGQVESLESRISDLQDKDAELRLLAGLEAIDPEVMEVGVGGPGTATPASEALWAVDSTLSKETFAVSYDLRALERRARLLEASMTEATDSLQAHRDLLESTPSILPTAGMLSSGFSRSRFHPVHHRPLPHEGIDISAPKGTPILAAAKGTVTFVGRRAGLGLTVEIDHGFGYMTRYGHASALLVRRGQKVARGDVIAQVGKTGITTSSHLHYEVLVAGDPVNPMNFVLRGAVP